MGDIIRPMAHFLPSDFPVAMNQSQVTLRQSRHDCINDIAKIPVHYFLPETAII
jgi:hypothetical protein